MNSNTPGPHSITEESIESFDRAMKELLDRPDLHSTILDDACEESWSVLEESMLDAILKNQEEKKKLLVDIVTKISCVESSIDRCIHIKPPIIVKSLPIQSFEMHLNFEKSLLNNDIKHSLITYANSIICESNKTQFTKELLAFIFDKNFFKENVVFKQDAEKIRRKIVLNNSVTLSCIYDCIRKKFCLSAEDLEDTIIAAVYKLKDSFRKMKH